MLRKHFSKTGRKCRVTFKVAPETQAEEASLIGEFDAWSGRPMKRLKDGSFSATVSLDAGREYRFRYLFDGADWANDDEADDYVANVFGTQDSVVQL